MLLRRGPPPGWQEQLNSKQLLQHNNFTSRALAYCRAAQPAVQCKAELTSARGSRGAVQRLDLAGRTCAVVWDLDNVCPSNPRTSLLPAIQEVKRLLFSLGLDQEPALTCYANTVTARALGEQQCALVVDVVHL